MKTRRNLIQIWLLCAAMLALPAVAQAQDYTYTTNNGKISITGYIGPGGDVTIPSTINGLPVTSIGVSAFQVCTNVTSVTIGTNVTSIGQWAFQECYNLTSVTIPPSATYIGSQAFLNCDSLRLITVATNNPAYSSVDGVLFNKNQTTLIQYPEGKAGSSYPIPASVTSIGVEAFSDCYSLTNVTIPASVISIEDGAFLFCDSLTSVTIPGSVASIGKYAFEGCNNLPSVTIPPSVTSIGFEAFSDCYSLTNVTLGTSVPTIGAGAFLFCQNLSAITVATNNLAYSNVGGVLFNKNQTTLVQYPESKAGSNYPIPASVTNIAVYAFGACSSLTNVAIPDNVTSIGAGAFFWCSLTSVTIPASVTGIGTEAFWELGSLRSVYFKGNAPNLLFYPPGFVFSSTPVTRRRAIEAKRVNFLEN